MKTKKIIISLMTLLCCTGPRLQAQIHVSNSTEVHFFSEAPMENIEATSKQSSAVLNIQSGELGIVIPISSFQFDSKLMQEHFNENYMESEKYPKAEFKGKISNLASVDFKKDGEYVVQIAGDLTIHGVKKARNISAKLLVKSGSLTGTSKFKVTLEEHNIERPKIMWEKIAEVVDVDVKFVFVPYVKK